MVFWMGICLTLVGVAAMFVFVIWTVCVVLYILCPQIFAHLIHRLTVYWASFTEKCVSVGDYSFSYIERGNRDEAENILLMLHGFTGDKDVWCHMGGALPKSLYLVAVDLPGHGYTTRKHHDDHSIPAMVTKLHQFVVAIGLDKRKFHLVGLSMGGHVAGIFAARYQSLLSSLVLMCPAGINAPKLSVFLSEIATGGRNYLLPESPEDFQYMLKKVSHRIIPMPYFVVKIMTAARRGSNEFFRKVLTDISHPDQRFLLHTVLEDITVPTLVLWGEHDEILDVSAVDVIREKIKHCQIQIIDSCGHAITIERPWKSAKLILRFINSLPQKDFKAGADLSKREVLRMRNSHVTDRL